MQAERFGEVPMQREFVIDLDELTKFSFECHGCGTETTFDLARQQAGGGVNCANCQKQILKTAQTGQRLHNAASLLKVVAEMQGDGPERNPFRFRVRQP